MELEVKRLSTQYGVSESFVKDVFEYIEDFGANDKMITLALVSEYQTSGFDKGIAKNFVNAYKRCH